MEWQLLQEGGADPSDPGARNPAPGTSTEGTGVGHSALPANVVLLEEGQNASHLYGDVVGDDLDAPKTVQDRIADRDKLRLMRQFFLAVSIYITVAVLVFFLPLFAPMTVDAALLVAYDCILWVFLAGLLWVFRLRQSNQFLLLTDDAVVGETTTELGVLYHDGDDDENEGPGSRYGGFGGARNGGVRSGAPAPAAPKYTLGDDEDEGQRYGGTRGRADSMEVNASAARHGVVVESLPTPQ